jgi:uncharacterized protein with HEPN domain
MLEMARKVAQKLDGVDRSHYDEDENLRLALTHLLQVIGEAASRVSGEFRDASPQIEWSAIIGMRQKVVHDYMNSGRRYCVGDRHPGHSTADLST